MNRPNARRSSGRIIPRYPVSPARNDSVPTRRTTRATSVPRFTASRKLDAVPEGLRFPVGQSDKRGAHSPGGERDGEGAPLPEVRADDVQRGDEQDARVPEVRDAVARGPLESPRGEARLTPAPTF